LGDQDRNGTVTLRSKREDWTYPVGERRQWWALSNRVQVP